jgi:aspartate carbamoyltransferase catalytic subunit
MEKSNWCRKSLLGIEELTNREIKQVLELSKVFKNELSETGKRSDLFEG